MALGEICRRFSDRLYRYALALTHDHHDAEDVLQMTLARLYRYLPTYEGTEGQFGAWLFTTARNQAFDLLEKRGDAMPATPIQVRSLRDKSDDRWGNLEEIPPHGWIEDPRVLLALLELPAAQREVLRLRYLEDLELEEIARLRGQKAA
ncbi:MAG: polymerase sigma-70 factor, subfamily, partial [Solirubrobacterales bacterium]|nr:polymerase sigma-70 factor, subfamily [Solirubrobacterales bacterium]